MMQELNYIRCGDYYISHKNSLRGTRSLFLYKINVIGKQIVNKKEKSLTSKRKCDIIVDK